MNPITIQNPQADGSVQPTFTASGIADPTQVQSVAGLLQQNLNPPVGSTFAASQSSFPVNRAGGFSVTFQNAPAGSWFLNVSSVQNPAQHDIIPITVQGSGQG
jgi:hypothetical protein